MDDTDSFAAKSTDADGKAGKSNIVVGPLNAAGGISGSNDLLDSEVALVCNIGLEQTTAPVGQQLVSELKALNVEFAEKYRKLGEAYHARVLAASMRACSRLQA